MNRNTVNLHNVQPLKYLNEIHDKADYMLRLNRTRTRGLRRAFYVIRNIATKAIKNEVEPIYYDLDAANSRIDELLAEIDQLRDEITELEGEK